MTHSCYAIRQFPHHLLRTWRIVVITLLLCGGTASSSRAEQTVDHPFLGVTHITRTETSPRTIKMHIVEIDLTIPGIRFRLSPSGGTLEAVRQTTLAYLNAQQAQLALNSHFFLPFPSADLNAMLIGLAASDGNVYSAFEAPVQSYALVTNAPGINIDPANQASVVHRNVAFNDGTHVIEPVVLWNALSGSGQIVTNGLKTIPTYVDAAHPDGVLTPGGPANYSNTNSWYNLINARTAIGLSQDNRTLVLFTVDRAGGSLGMSVGEVADVLIDDYGVYNALNLDGGGSTTLAMENPLTHTRSLVNVSADNPAGRMVASSLAVFADADTVPPSTTASVSPSPNVNGWNNRGVDVTLTAVDNPGGAVLGIQVASAGAHAEASTLVSGNTTSLTISEEGTTTVTYFATDFVANVEQVRSLIVHVDETRPVIDGMPSGTCVLWPPNGSWRRVATVTASDALAGVDPSSFQVSIASSEGPDEDTAVRPDGQGRLEVLLRARRAGSGGDRTYVVTATVEDRAGNATRVTSTCVVPHDERK